ncbi:hypothetical protein SIID45300_01067 [Candidatus Magnetaquicoccaceae bacterium FCR-1]|uniref:Uncharacterized protein n=1 Tax=Candidatus Magnetaquiglobus chichijimensis TaxID=3141448 RepID=A0ABQ0C786_9PROT
MSDKKHQLMGYPFASDITVRLRIFDESGVIVSPVNGLVAIKVYLITGTNQYGKPIKIEIASIGQPIYQPYIAFVVAGSSHPPFYRPVRRDDYNGYWAEGVFNLGRFNYEYPTQMARDKLAELGVTAVNTAYLDKQQQWLEKVAELDAVINELTRQLATLDPDSANAAVLRDLIAEKKAEKERYFHGLTTISQQDLMYPTLYANGRYVLRIKKIRLRELFGIERPEFFFRVLPLNSPPVISPNGIFCQRYHPGTTYPFHPEYGWPFMADDGVSPGDHDIWLRQYYRDVEYGINLGGVSPGYYPDLTPFLNFL